MATVAGPSDSVAGPPRPGGGGARWQLGRRARQVVLLSHVVAVGCWLGLDVAFGILVLVALRADDGATAAAAVLAIVAVAG